MRGARARPASSRSRTVTTARRLARCRSPMCRCFATPTRRCSGIARVCPRPMRAAPSPANQRRISLGVVPAHLKHTWRCMQGKPPRSSSSRWCNAPAAWPCTTRPISLKRARCATASRCTSSPMKSPWASGAPAPCSPASRPASRRIFYASPKASLAATCLCPW